MRDSRITQRSRILDLLIAECGAWVPLPKIMECAAQYNTRILELRREGHRIPPPRTEIVNGKRHTWYRIDLGPAEPAMRDVPLTEKTGSECLFTIAELEHTARWEDRG